MKFEDLKASLVSDFNPSPKLASVQTQSIRFLIFATLLATLIISTIGLRTDLHLNFNNIGQNFEYYIELLILIGIATTSCVVSLKMATPGINVNNYLGLLSTLILSWLCLLSWSAPTIENHLTEPEYSCSRLVLISTILFGFFIIGMISKHFPTRPILNSFLALLASSSIGAVILQLVCPGVSFQHLFFWHFMPMIFMPAVGTILVRRLF